MLKECNHVIEELIAAEYYPKAIPKIIVAKLMYQITFIGIDAR